MMGEIKHKVMSLWIRDVNVVVGVAALTISTGKFFKRS
jgi:hypothetical protein